jgi:hypothetical protein
MDYIIDRAKEPSTWRGIFLILGAVGVPVAPDLANEIMATAMSAAGLIGVLTADKK